jgi:hypothetical protein
MCVGCVLIGYILNNRRISTYVSLISTQQEQAADMSSSSNSLMSARSNTGIHFNDSYRFPQITLWSSDFHISPVADIKSIVSVYMGSRVIDKSLSGHCHLANTCERDLRVINKQNGIRLEPCPNDIITEFYASYRY